MTKKWKPLLEDVTLSPKSKPGRLGFVYAIEFNHKDYYYTNREMANRYDRWRRHRDFWAVLEKEFGKEYQQHWKRKQLNRRWYRYTVDKGDITRYCFRNKADRLLAWMLYK